MDEEVKNSPENNEDIVEDQVVVRRTTEGK